jgi:hypothetical protein
MPVCQRGRSRNAPHIKCSTSRWTRFVHLTAVDRQQSTWTEVAIKLNDDCACSTNTDGVTLVQKSIHQHHSGKPWTWVSTALWRAEAAAFHRALTKGEISGSLRSNAMNRSVDIKRTPALMQLSPVKEQVIEIPSHRSIVLLGRVKELQLGRMKELQTMASIPSLETPAQKLVPHVRGCRDGPIPLVCLRRRSPSFSNSPSGLSAGSKWQCVQMHLMRGPTLAPR